MVGPVDDARLNVGATAPTVATSAALRRGATRPIAANVAAPMSRWRRENRAVWTSFMASPFSQPLERVEDGSLRQDLGQHARPGAGRAALQSRIQQVQRDTAAIERREHPGDLGRAIR